MRDHCVHSLPPKIYIVNYPYGLFKDGCIDNTLRTDGLKDG